MTRRRALCAALLIPFLAYLLLLAESRRRLVVTRDWRQGPDYFTKQDGHWTTNNDFMAHQRFPAEKAPGAFRIFVVGGYQAMGTPYVDQDYDRISRFLPNEGGLSTWIKAYLGVLLPGRQVEVINAASNIGQGMALHLAIFKAVLAVGRPDAVVFLCSWPGPGDLEDYGHFDKKYLDEFAALADSSGTPLYVLTPASNLRDWAPSEEGPASKLFQAAKVHDAAGRFEKARALYLQARDEDAAFTRTRTAWNDVLRGAKGRMVRVFDLEKILFTYAKDGIPGNDLFLDYSHFRMETYQSASLELVKRFAADGLVSGEKRARLDGTRLPEIRPRYLDFVYAAQLFKRWRYEKYLRFENFPFVNSLGVRNGFKQARVDFKKVENVRRLYDEKKRKR